jgi:hypothetical protein
MPFGTYGSVTFDDDATEDERCDFMMRLTEWLRSGHYSLVEVVDFEGNWPAPGADWLKRQDTFTHIIRLSEAGTLPFGAGVLQEIKTGERRDAIVREINGPQEVQDFYDLYLKSIKRRGKSKSVYSLRFFKTVFDVLNGTEKLRWTVAAVGGRIVGSQINFIHDETLYYWQGVMDYARREHKPTYLLINDAIETAKRLGLKKINMGATPPDAPGLIDFKRKWGSHRYDYALYRRRFWIRELFGR